MPQEFDPSEFQFWAGCGQFDNILILPQRWLERDGLVFRRLRDLYSACRGQYEYWYLYHDSFKTIISDLREIGFTYSEGIFQELNHYHPDFGSLIQRIYRYKLLA